MSLDGNARAQVQYNLIPNKGKLNAQEQQQLLAGLQAIYGADTSYLVTNTTVVPAGFSVPAGQTVTTAGSATAQTGTVTSAGIVAGTGNIS